MRVISWLAEKLLASEEGPCSTELVSETVKDEERVYKEESAIQPSVWVAVVSVDRTF
jgi:hypothetical protein